MNAAYAKRKNNALSNYAATTLLVILVIVGVASQSAYYQTVRFKNLTITETAHRSEDGSPRPRVYADETLLALHQNLQESVRSEVDALVGGKRRLVFFGKKSDFLLQATFTELFDGSLQMDLTGWDAAGETELKAWTQIVESGATPTDAIPLFARQVAQDIATLKNTL